MLRRFSHICHSTHQRAIYIVCMCFVFSYIAFNILDLDGSNLRSFVRPVERLSIVAIIPSVVEIPYSSESGDNELRNNNLFSTSDKISPRQAHVSVPAPGFLARAHGYKVSLARNSLSDAAPDH
jgi:hypothetical protein